MSIYSQKSAKIVIQKQNPYFNKDYKSLYNFNPEKETFYNIKYARIKSYTVQARTVAQSN